MDTLPTEIIYKIFSYLRNIDILKLQLWSRKIYNIIKNYSSIQELKCIYKSLINFIPIKNKINYIYVYKLYGSWECIIEIIIPIECNTAFNYIIVFNCIIDINKNELIKKLPFKFTINEWNFFIQENRFHKIKYNYNYEI